MQRGVKSWSRPFKTEIVRASAVEQLAALLCPAQFGCYYTGCVAFLLIYIYIKIYIVLMCVRVMCDSDDAY